jgi:hypothetical protein
MRLLLRMRRRPRRVAVAALVALTAAAGGTAFATSLTVTPAKLGGWHAAAGCTPGTVTLSASDDATIDQGSPNSNFGASTDLKVKAPLLGALGINLGGERYTLARFTLPSLQLCSVTLAKLRLYATSPTSGRNLEADRVTQTWAEGTVTWNTKPSVTTTGAVTITSGSGTGYREWTVTSMVTAMYPPGSNFGFLVSDSSGLSLLAPEQIYNSDEAAANKPQLVVTYG